MNIFGYFNPPECESEFWDRQLFRTYEAVFAGSWRQHMLSFSRELTSFFLFFVLQFFNYIQRQLSQYYYWKWSFTCSIKSCYYYYSFCRWLFLCFVHIWESYFGVSTCVPICWMSKCRFTAPNFCCPLVLRGLTFLLLYFSHSISISNHEIPHRKL